MERIEDKLDDHGRTFTDGVGKISPTALKKVSSYIFDETNTK